MRKQFKDTAFDLAGQDEKVVHDEVKAAGMTLKGVEERAGLEGGIDGSVGRAKLFEMPVLGFAGYLPFGWECAALGDWLALALALPDDVGVPVLVRDRVAADVRVRECVAPAVSLGDADEDMVADWLSLAVADAYECQKRDVVVASPAGTRAQA